MHETSHNLTGYGDSSKCKLCRPIKSNCELCVYGKLNHKTTETNLFCNTGINKKTYFDISDSQTPKKLLKAYKARAKHMRNILKQLTYENTIKDSGQDN